MPTESYGNFGLVRPPTRGGRVAGILQLGHFPAVTSWSCVQGARVLGQAIGRYRLAV